MRARPAEPALLASGDFRPFTNSCVPSYLVHGSTGQPPRVHSGVRPASHHVKLSSGRVECCMDAFARAPGAASISKHDQCRAGLWRRVALRGQRGWAQAAELRHWRGCTG